MHTHHDQTNDRSETRDGAGLAALFGCACLIAAGCAGQHEVQRGDSSARESRHDIHREAARERGQDQREVDATRHERTAEPMPLTTPTTAPSMPATTLRAAEDAPRSQVVVKPTPIVPLDESNSDADRQLAARVRKSIGADDSLSVSAKNVRIISNGGEVTLRGAVATAAEKSRVESDAQHAAGSKRVNNELEITK